MDSKREKAYQATADKLVILLIERIIRENVEIFAARVNEILELVSLDTTACNVCASLLPDATYAEIAVAVYDTHPDITNDDELDGYLIDILLAVTRVVVTNLAKTPKHSKAS